MMVTFNWTEISTGYDQPEIYKADWKSGGLSRCGQPSVLGKVPQYTSGPH